MTLAATQTDRRSLLTAFRKHVFPLLTDQNKRAHSTRNKSTHANKSQAIVVWRIGILKRLC